MPDYILVVSTETAEQQNGQEQTKSTPKNVKEDNIDLGIFGTILAQ